MDVSLEKLLSICYVIPMGDPMDPACIWGGVPSLEGRPGIGKSARVRQSGQRVNLQTRVIELGGRLPEDASGAAFLNKEDDLVIACLLGGVNDLNKIGSGILFLDEVNWARPTTQGAFLSAVQERRVGDTIFSNLIRVVLASNPSASAGGGHPLIPPMANRVFHFSIDAPTEKEENQYLMGASKNVTPIDDVELKVKEKWQDVWGKMVGFMIGFKKQFSEYVLAEPKPGDPEHHKAWPSPRSREMALRAVTTVRILELTHDEKTGKEIISPLEDAFVEAACGKKMASDWAAYRAEANIPTPEEMLSGKWKPRKSERADLMMAAFAGCTSYVLTRSDKAERENLAGPMYDLIHQLFDLGLGDLGVENARALVRNNLHMHTLKGTSAQMCKKVLAEFSKRGMEKYVEE